jgi:hypothetical protein
MGQRERERESARESTPCLPGSEWMAYRHVWIRQPWRGGFHTQTSGDKGCVVSRTYIAVVARITSPQCPSRPGYINHTRSQAGRKRGLSSRDDMIEWTRQPQSMCMSFLLRRNHARPCRANICLVDRSLGAANVAVPKPHTNSRVAHKPTNAIKNVTCVPFVCLDGPTKFDSHATAS